MAIWNKLFRPFLDWRYKQHLHPRDVATFGPKYDAVKLVDEGFLASWDKVTAKIITDKTTAFRLGYLTEDQAITFFTSLDNEVKRKWNDQRFGYVIGEPIEASYKYDKITDYGLSLFCALIVGKTAPLISHMGIGDGAGDTYDYQDTLSAEKVRLAFSDQGYINSLGRTLRFHMTYDIMMASATFTEIGLFNNEHMGVGPLVARSVFDPGVEHTSGFNYITGSYLISTLSA